MKRAVAISSMGAAVTGALTLVMAHLSAPAEDIGPQETVPDFKVPPIFAEPIKDIVPVKTAIPEPPEVPEPPTDIELIPETFDPVDPCNGPCISFKQPEAELPELPGMGGIGIPDGPAVALVRVQPRYPRSALERGIEGSVVVSFSIGADGQAYDAVVVEASPPGVFDRSALAAIAKFRFRAKVVNGTPVATHNRTYRLRYQLPAK